MAFFVKAVRETPRINKSNNEIRHVIYVLLYATKNIQYTQKIVRRQEVTVQ